MMINWSFKILLIKMDFNQLGPVIYEILNWLPYSDIINFCLTCKDLSKTLDNNYFYQQYLLKNYDIKQPIKELGYFETMKITYELLRVMNQKGIVVSKGLFGEILKYSNVNDLNEYKTNLSLIGLPGFLKTYYNKVYVNPSAITRIVFLHRRVPSEQEVEEYRKSVQKIKEASINENQLKARLFKLVEKYMTQKTDYIVDINKIKTIPYNRDFFAFLIADGCEEELWHIRKCYKHSDIYYYRYFSKNDN